MDERLEAVDRMLAANPDMDAERELSFALAALDTNDPATLNWLAATCAVRADELSDETPESCENCGRPLNDLDAPGFACDVCGATGER